MHWSEYSYHDPKKVHFFLSEDPLHSSARILALAEVGTPEQQKVAEELVFEDDDLLLLDESFRASSQKWTPGIDSYAGYCVFLALRHGTEIPKLKTSLIDAILRDDDRSLCAEIVSRMENNGWTATEILHFRNFCCAIWA